jgi:hypothetical protein
MRHDAAYFDQHHLVAILGERVLQTSGDQVAGSQHALDSWRCCGGGRVDCAQDTARVRESKSAVQLPRGSWRCHVARLEQRQ